MASRRKSTTPCMVLSSQALEQDAEMEVTEGDTAGEGTSASAPAEGAVVSHESEAECNLRHQSGEDGFTWTASKRKTQTAFEQTARDLTFDGSLSPTPEDEEAEDSVAMEISFSKTPIMKMRSKAEAKRIAVSHPPVDEGDVAMDSEQDLGEVVPVDGPGTALPAEQVKHCIIISSQSQVLTEPKKTLINSATVLPAGLAQVLSALQVQQNPQAQLLIPVSSIPTYNTAMDNSSLLANTYNKFPYPSVSEIMSLALQTKFSEEQIKIWFSAQRLKHGVSWTPEEVEEARRRQFNGTVHTVPPTITVIPAHLSAATNGLHSILQTCQIVGQPGLLLTQLGGANTLPVTAPIALTVTGLPSQVQPAKPASVQTAPVGAELRRTSTLQPPTLTAQESNALSPDHLGLRAKKSKEQLAELKNSYLKNHFASDTEIARLMKLTSLTKGEIKKWFSDTRYNQRNSKNSHGAGFSDATSQDSAAATIVIDSSDETTESPTPGPAKETRSKASRNPFPDFTLQKFKEKTPEQLLLLERSFQKDGVPSDEELSRLRMETKLTRREIDAWFTERRKGPGLLEVKAEPVDADMEMAKVGSSPNRRRASREKASKKSPEQLHVLKAAFVRTQWPSADDYDKLAEESGLDRPYIVNWFGDTRYAWKNGTLKWYHLYQSGNTGAVNGTAYRKRGRGRARNRGRGWTRRNRRSAGGGRSRTAIKVKSGKEVLKEYYLKHKFLNEQDLDELVAKSGMSYEQVRDWFRDTGQREDMGLEPFGESGLEKQQQGTEGGGEGVAQEDVVAKEGDGNKGDDRDPRDPSRSVRKSVSED